MDNNIGDIASSATDTAKGSPIATGIGIGAATGVVKSVSDYLHARRNLLRMIEACNTKECRDQIRVELDILKQDAIGKGIVTAGVLGSLGGIGGNIYNKLRSIEAKKAGVAPSIFKVDGSIYNNEVPLWKKIGLPMAIAVPAATAMYATQYPVAKAHKAITTGITNKLANPVIGNTTKRILSAISKII